MYFRNKKAMLSFYSIAILILLMSIFFINNYQKSKLPGEAVTVMKKYHIVDPSSPHKPYNSDPATSGPHTEYILSWGIYKEPIPQEVLVHNLEDGGVVIYYNKNASTEFQRLSTMFDSEYKDSRLVIVPYPEMRNKITLTAWGRIERLDNYDEGRIKNFINVFMGIDNH